MNKLEKQRAVNDFKEIYTDYLTLRKNTCGDHQGCLRFSEVETKEHIQKKLELCIEARELDEPFYTELLINCQNNRWRKVDFCYPRLFEVYEIQNSETDEISELKTKLPDGLTEYRIKI